MKRGLCVLPLVVFFLALSGKGIAADSRTFVGSDTCMGCHEKQARLIVKTPHWKKQIPGAPINGQGCEACHGPGSLHAEKGGGRGVGGLITFGKNEPAAGKSAVCLTCHENTTQLALWESGIHKKMDVSCSDCHTVHRVPGSPMGYGTTMTPLGYVPGPEYQICGRCHLDIKARINRRSHHPIVEGRVTCSNCHQPHGSMNPSQIREASVNQLCYKCHAEKRGPFMWEHPPVDENCATCHTPHGSVHEWLLVEKVPNLCQGCHDSTTHPGTRYSRETQWRGAAPALQSVSRACLNCHSNIHGSNAPANPGNTFNSGTFFLR